MLPSPPSLIAPGESWVLQYVCVVGWGLFKKLHTTSSLICLIYSSAFIFWPSWPGTCRIQPQWTDLPVVPLIAPRSPGSPALCLFHTVLSASNLPFPFLPSVKLYSSFKTWFSNHLLKKLLWPQCPRLA